MACAVQRETHEAIQWSFAGTSTMTHRKTVEFGIVPSVLDIVPMTQHAEQRSMCQMLSHGYNIKDSGYNAKVQCQKQRDLQVGVQCQKDLKCNDERKVIPKQMSGSTAHKCAKRS